MKKCQTGLTPSLAKDNQVALEMTLIGRVEFQSVIEVHTVRTVLMGSAVALMMINAMTGGIPAIMVVQMYTMKTEESNTKGNRVIALMK